MAMYPFLFPQHLMWMTRIDQYALQQKNRVLSGGPTTKGPGACMPNLTKGISCREDFPAFAGAPTEKRKVFDAITLEELVEVRLCRERSR
jgi:hypothetical protein